MHDQHHICSQTYGYQNPLLYFFINFYGHNGRKRNTFENLLEMKK